MNLFGFVLLFLGFIVCLQVTLRVSKVSHRKQAFQLKKFLERDREANLARRQEVGSDLFITPDISGLPVRTYGEAPARKAALKQARALEKAKLPMVRFDTERTNTELKLAYGRDTLEDIIVYEENFQEYVRALIEWSEALAEDGEREAAAQVLRNSVEIGSDLSRSYTELADIYAELGERRAITELLVKADAIKNELTRKKVIEYLNALNQGGAE